MKPDATPTARALLALELVQGAPGITAERLPLDGLTTRLVGSTSNPVWYVEQFAAVPACYRIVSCPELQEAARALGERLLAAAGRPLTARPARSTQKSTSPRRPGDEERA